MEDLFTQVTREDLRRLNLKGGILCRIWNAIESHKRADSGNNLLDICLDLYSFLFGHTCRLLDILHELMNRWFIAAMTLGVMTNLYQDPHPELNKAVI